MFFMLTSIESKKMISWNKHKLIIKNIKISTKITDLRRAKVTPIHRGSVLLSKQEDLWLESNTEPRWIGVTLAPRRSVILVDILYF